MASPILRSARVIAALALAITASLSSPVSGQDSRAAQIAAEQDQKATTLGTEGPGRAEMTVVRLMKSPLLAGTGGAFPWFGSVYEGTSFGLGGGYLRRMPRHSELLAVAGISVNGSTVLRGEYSAPALARETVQPFVTVEWARANGVSFYGLGNDTTPEQRTDYDFDPLTLRAGLGYHPVRPLVLSASVERLGFRTEVTQATVDAGPVPSDNRSLQFNGLRLGAAFDTRPSAGYSTRGTLLRATIARYGETGNQPYDFQQSRLEAVQLVPLVREQFVLAFHAAATFTDGAHGDTPPLALLPYLGGGTTLRGFATRRFVDRDSLLLTGEYRWRPSRYLDMALFLDAGRVSASDDPTASRRLHRSWGVGSRFHGPGFSALRLEFAHSVEGSRIVLTTGAPF